MSENRNSQEPKKGLPGGVFAILGAALLGIFALQLLNENPSAGVSFSHQAEHLVNLQLTQPESNQKIAQNDHLVTFSGKFREQETQEGLDRFRYLELLNQNHLLALQEQEATTDLGADRAAVLDAADLYVHLTGNSLSKSGFVVVGPQFDTSERINSVVLKTLSSRPSPNLKEIEQTLLLATGSGNPEVVDQVGKELRAMVSTLRSPALGIGSEAIKERLAKADEQLNGSGDLAVYASVLGAAKQVIDELGVDQSGVRLGELRSVRSYVQDVQTYTEVMAALEENEQLLDKARSKVASVTWYFNNQELSTRALEKQDREAYCQWFTQAEAEWTHFGSNKGLDFRAPDQPRSVVLDRTFQSQEPAPNYISYFFTMLPILMVILFLYFIFSRQMKGVGSGAMNFGKSPAKLMTKEQNRYTFKDVAGCDEAKEELKEIVDFLKDPTKFTALGARIPKGVLLVGSPGTGKTLVAKAVAGEADRPFFSISGSDFVEMFVGVGASRIRDLFDQARKSAPCIIFIDEIDAVGRHRGAGIGGGHDEREQTLNQLLVEMDGFDTKEGVILVAATNRPDILDKALLRPGRFDRRVVLDLPDVKGRFEILKVHARRIKIDGTVDLMDVARNTPGASGADLENILNEAALLAARRGRTAVTASEVKEASDKVRFGKERRSLEMDEQEKLTTAYHEAGHAIAGLVVKYADPVDKVTIIPRGFSLGATHFMPKKNRLGYWRKEALDQLVVLMGGRAAEEIFVGDMSSGATHDFSQATRMARAMVCEWGMSDRLGTMSYDEKSEQGQYLGAQNYQDRHYSEETARQIDIEVRKFLDEAYKRAKEILEHNRGKVELMAKMLMEFETLDATDVKEMMDGTWDSEKKRARIKTAEEAYRPKMPPLPPLPETGPVAQPGMG
jgi:cell division protease FtsH